MINYDTKEMQYISDKHPVMKTLVEHYGKIQMGKVKDIYVIGFAYNKSDVGELGIRGLDKAFS